MLIVPSTASAHSPVHPETRVGDFEVAAETCIRPSALANSSTHQENAAASTAEAVGYPHATKGAGSALSKAGQALDRGGLTKAGRALEKHGSRPGSVFGKATGNVSAKNAQGQAALDDILGGVS